MHDGRRGREVMATGERPHVARPDTIRKALEAIERQAAKAEAGELQSMLYTLRGSGRSGSMKEIKDEYLAECRRLAEKVAGSE